jgi:hypothetical protein
MLQHTHAFLCAVAAELDPRTLAEPAVPNDPHSAFADALFAS